MSHHNAIRQTMAMSMVQETAVVSDDFRAMRV